MAAATFVLGIDWNRDGTYSDYTGYLDGVGNGFDISNGGSSEDGGFRSASFNVSLRNVSGEFNRNYSSAGTYGLMGERVPIRIQSVHGATTTMWAGYINEYDGPHYDPTGVNDASWINLRCSGLLATIAEDEVDVDADPYDIDGAFAAAFASLGLTVTTDYVTSDSDQAITLFFAQKEKAQTVFRDLLASEMGGAVFETKAGVATFKPRDSLLHGTVDATWGDDNASSPKVYPSRVRTIVRDKMADKVDVTTRQFQLGAGGVVIYEAPLGEDKYTGGPFRSQLIPAGQSIGPWYIVPNRIGGKSGWTGTPTSTPYLDYTATASSDGTGSDRTADLTVTFSGNYVTRTNTSGSDLYQTSFRIRAVAISDGSGTVPGAITLDSPTGADDASAGTVAWTNPDRVVASDNSYATIVLTAGQTSHYLAVDDLGASIPNAATIQGVVFEVECKDGTQTTQALSAKLIKAGAVQTTTRTATIGTTEAYIALGSSADTWGTTLTPEDVNNAGFGVALYISSALADTYSIDHVTMTVFYNTTIGVAETGQTYTAELAIPGVKGGQRKTFLLPWVSDSTKARDYGQQMLRIHRYPEEMIELSFPWKNDGTINAMELAELYQLIAYQDTSVGPSRGAYVDETYRIIGMQQRAVIGSVPETVVLLRPSYNFRDLDHIVWDDFNRADNPSSLGITPTGKTWVDLGAGTGWKILNNKARPLSAALEVQHFDLGAANFIGEVTISNISSDATALAGFSFRLLNSSNYNRLQFSTSANTLAFITVVAGSSTTVQSVAFTPPDVVELRVMAQGNRVRAWANRKLLIDASSSANNTRTNHGFLSFTNTTFDFDDAYFQGL